MVLAFESVDEIQAPVVQRADNFIQWLKCPPTDTFYLWDSDLSVIHPLNNRGLKYNQFK